VAFKFVRRSLRILILPTLLAAQWVMAAPPASPQSMSDASDERAPTIQLGPGDTVTINVYGQPDMNASVYVADDGTVPVNLAGAVKVGGMSPDQAAHAIEDALRNGGFFKNPQVTMTVTQSRSSRVSVLGEVGTAGRYTVESNTTLLELLAQAGGMKDTASTLIYLIRADESGKATRYPINTEALQDPLGDVPTLQLKGGDTILVPKAEHYYIYGEVKQPNMYRLEPGLTLVEAIVRAGGLTPRGSNSRIEVQRKDKDGRVIAHKMRQNEAIEPDDIIRVKESIF